MGHGRRRSMHSVRRSGEPRVRNQNDTDEQGTTPTTPVAPVTVTDRTSIRPNPTAPSVEPASIMRWPSGAPVRLKPDTTFRSAYATGNREPRSQLVDVVTQ